MMSVGQMCSQEAEDAPGSDVDVPRTKKSSSKRARSRKHHSPAPVVEDRESSVHEDEDGDDDDDESSKSENGGSGGGGSDHNRWYCNICKDGGELLCCDRCPRAFHTACLTMDPDDIPRPDSSWYCKLCSDTLERRTAKRAMKDQKRHQREEEKRQRDLVREAKMREKDEALARRSAKALEDKTKRVLDMKERIVKKQKVTYKDREEEKLGKIAENSAESIRQAKEKLEKLEKEDLLLKRKEQALAKSRRQADPDEVADLAGPLPEAKPCHFGGIPSTMFRQVLSAWDFVVSFQNAVGISAMTIDQLCAALVSPKFCPLVNELHMCLLDLILESREVDTSVSEEDAEMDPLDRYRFEVAHAPLTVGVPTSNMLNVLSWPAVLANLITAVPRYFNNASPAIKAAVAALRETEYPQLLLHHKIALLDLLVALAYSTDKIGRIVNLHVQERTDASKEHNRLLFQEKRDKAEENKRLVEQQKADKAKLASEQKVAMQNWLKGGKMGAAPVVDEAVSQSPLDDDATSATQSDDSDNSSDEDDEELKSLQAKGIISRQEYLARKKKRDMERDARRKHKEERARRTKQKEQLLKKRALVIEELNLAMEMRDLNRLHMSLKAAKENGMHTLKKPKLSTTGVFVAATPQDVKLYEDAVEFADRLEADAAKEHEMDERKQAFDKAMRKFFIRTQSLGKDSHRSKYWLFRGDAKRMYVEHVDGKWSYYDSPSSVQQLMDALPEGHPLKKELVPHVDTLVKEMNKAVAPSSTDDWENKAKTWGSSTLYDLTLDEVKKELLQVQAAVTTRLVNARGTMWVHIDQNEWSENVAAATSISGLVNAVLALEREVSDDKGQYKVEEDEDDEEEDETFVQNSLWPSKKCRDRWIAVVTQCQTLSNVALSLASLVQRMDIWTLTGGGGAAKKDAKAKRELKRADEDGGDGGSEVSPTKPKRLPPPSTHPPEREWEEYCCICKDGGDLLCCDGCPKVFHFTCVGLRRIPRGKTFCPSCDRSVKPVYPVVMPASDNEPKADQPSTSAAAPIMKSEEEWDAFCGICESGGELLLCDGCPKAFHVECLQLENFDEHDDWFCVDCENQSCGLCKKGRIRMDSHVICGNEAGTKGCERVFHLKCVKLDQVPVDDWFCKRCLKLAK